ncbi:hypothetical protein V8G54_017792 [Vigna mungo]|uniref:Uncharacterized protein n=1 Tax=Vigna mungo TaxID=3915 RepID=A0AAQ3S0L4_VIGMU
MKQRPLHRGGARVRPGADNLRHERHELFLPQLSTSRHLQPEQRVHVSSPDGTCHFISGESALHVGLSIPYQRRQQFHLSFPQLPGLLYLASEQRREHGQKVWKLGERDEHDVLQDALYALDSALLYLGAEAEADEDAADGESAVAHDFNETLLTGLPLDPTHVGLHGPFSYPTALLDPQRGDHLGDEVLPEGAPERAVLGGVDGALPHAEDETDGGVLGPAGELWAALDESLVDEVRAGDDDQSALAHLHGEDWAVLLT